MKTIVCLIATILISVPAAGADRGVIAERPGDLVPVVHGEGVILTSSGKCMGLTTAG